MTAIVIDHELYDSVLIVLKDGLNRFNDWKKLCHAILHDNESYGLYSPAYEIIYINFNFIIKIWDPVFSKHITLKLKINDEIKLIFREMYDALSECEINKELEKIKLLNDEIDNAHLTTNQLNKLCDQFPPIYKMILSLLPSSYFNNIKKLADYIV